MQATSTGGKLSAASSTPLRPLTYGKGSVQSSSRISRSSSQPLMRREVSPGGWQPASGSSRSPKRFTLQHPTRSFGSSRTAQASEGRRLLSVSSPRLPVTRSFSTACSLSVSMTSRRRSRCGSLMPSTRWRRSNTAAPPCGLGNEANAPV